MHLVFNGDGNVLKKGNWLVLLGVVIILLGAVNFLFYYVKNAPSPFDVADPGTQSSDFLPIIAPVTGAGMPSGTAPTLEAISQDTAPVVQVTGLFPDRLVIPSIYLDAPIVPVHYKEIDSGGDIYHQWRVPAEFAVGWQDESALLGLPGNTVLNGHHNAYGMVFKNLIKLNIGDVIIVYSNGVEFRYVVAAKMLLPERGQTLATRLENARWIQPSLDERLTLVTCWPAESNTHRVIIVAFPEDTNLPPVGEQPAGN
jgi:LPXTG-site transpeptidase (sortase) family protein